MKKSEKWLVAVTAGRWQTHGIQEAKAAGLRVIAVDADPNAEGFLHAELNLCMDLSDHANVIEALIGLNKNICGAVSFCSEAGMSLAGKIRETFDLPGPRAELCRRLLEKSEQRRIWSESGIPGPSWKVFRTPCEALAAVESFGFPLVLKPTDSSGSRGVSKLESRRDDLDEAIARAFEFASSGEIIMESYMDGNEFTVETFGTNGNIYVLGVTEKKKVPNTRGTVANELATPNRPAGVIELIGQTVVSALNALGYLEGPGHTEVILQQDGSVGLVEAAGRGGGFMVFDKLVPTVSGVNIARCTALQAVGLGVGPIEVTQGAAVLRFFPSCPGRLKSIVGFDQANQLAGVEAGTFVKVGDVFSAAVADGDRLGYLLSRAETPQAAKELADEAEQKIRFEFEKCIAILE